MSTSTDDSIESADFDFCSPNYLNSLVETIVDEDMSDDPEPQQIKFQKDCISDKTINEKHTNIESRPAQIVSSDKLNISANQQPSINTALNTVHGIAKNNIAQHTKTRSCKNKYVYHLPKAISKNDIYKYKNSNKYRNILPTGKSHTIHGYNTNISNIRKPSLTISEFKQNLVQLTKKPISNNPVQSSNIQIYSSTCVKDLMVTSHTEDINKEETNVCKIVDTMQEKAHKDEIENVCNDSIKIKQNTDLVQIVNNDSARLKTIGSDDGIWDVDKTYSKEATMLQSFNSNEKHVTSLNPQTISVVRTSSSNCTTTNTTKDLDENQKVDLKTKIDKSTGNSVEFSHKNTRHIKNMAKLTVIRNKLNELHARIPMIADKLVDIPIFKDESKLESRFNLARKDLWPNSVVLNTSEDFNHEKAERSCAKIVENEKQNLPLDLSKHVPDISEELLCPIESTDLNLVTEKNNPQHNEKKLNPASETHITKKLFDAKLVQTEPIPISNNINPNNEFNITNMREVSMEITQIAGIPTNMHKDVSVMVNMSLENQNCDKSANDEKLNDIDKNTEITTKTLIEPSENISEKPEPKQNSITELIREKVDMVENSKEKTRNNAGETKKVIEKIVLDVLETLPELERLKKQYYRDSIDYIIEEVINRYTETKKKPKKTPKRKSLVRNKTCEVKKVRAEKCSSRKVCIQKSITKSKTTKQPEKIAMKLQNVKKTNPSNKIYESIEQLTQTIRATLDEFGKLHDSQNSILKELQVNKDKSSSELFNTNLSNLSYKFSATSTPLESEHYTAKCLRGLNIMQKKIGEMSKTQSKVSTNSTQIKTCAVKEKTQVFTDVAQKGKCTKQSTLTQTYNLQKNAQINSVFSKMKENNPPQKEGKVLNATPPDYDDLYIEIDLSDNENMNNCSNMNSLTNILKKVEQWKNDSCPWIGAIEYDEPRMFDPNYLIMFDNSQASTTQFPSNQEALRRKR